MRKFLLAFVIMSVAIVSFVCGSAKGADVDAVATAAAVCLLVGLAVGTPLGASYARTQRARSDFDMTRKAVPRLFRGWVESLGITAGRALVGLLIAVIAIVALTR